MLTAAELRRAQDNERHRRRYWSDPEYRSWVQQQNRERPRKPSPAAQARERQRKVEARQRLRLQVSQIKLQQGCVDCGYAQHPAALQFDHVNGQKLRIISHMVTSCAPWHAIVAEIAKCEVRCANCHAIKTAERAAEVTSA